MTTIQQTENAIAKGDLLRAFETISEHLSQYEDDHRGRYLQVLALARMGDISQAEQLYERYLKSGHHDVETLALSARILKDRALRQSSKVNQSRLFAEASRTYEKAMSIAKSPFCTINAATTALLSGDRDRARAFAKLSLELVGDTFLDYYGAVTAAEANLILGDLDDAKTNILRALSLPGNDYGSRSTTTGQLEYILKELELDAVILQSLRPPFVLTYTGHMFCANEALERNLSVRIADQINSLGSSIAYGSLACGADIVIAEQILARSGELHVILPFEIGDFIEVSVRPGGDAWIPRFETCLAAATDVEIASPTPVMEQDKQIAFGSHLMMGYAKLRAQHLNTSAMQLCVWDGVRTGSSVGTGADVRTWAEFGGSSRIVDFDRERFPSPETRGLCRAVPAKQEIKSIIFGDFVRFSQIAEGDLPIFWNEILGSAAKIIDRHDGQISSRNTWGDGLFIVLDDVVTAAKLALDLQEEMDSDAFQIFGDSAGMRIGVHLGAVFEATDPITKGKTFYGKAVNMTARIEPIASTGEVYVTRQFGAMLSMMSADVFQLAYVGKLKLAKDFGTTAMYRLTRVHEHNDQ